MIVICDLDGTLCDCRHRQHLAAQKDWDGFHDLLLLDPVIEHTRVVLNNLAEDGHPIFYLTGRPELLLGDTLKWFEQNLLNDACSNFEMLIMRPSGDFETDSKLKLRLFWEELKDPMSPMAETFMGRDFVRTFEDSNPGEGWSDWVEGNKDVVFANFLFLDDRERVIEALRNEGFTAWQVAMGAF